MAPIAVAVCNCKPGLMGELVSYMPLATVAEESPFASRMSYKMDALGSHTLAG